MTLVIFEGADNLGKTSIINKLTDKFKNERDILYIHFKTPPTDVKNSLDWQEHSFMQGVAKCSYMLNIENVLTYTNKNIVFFDRSYFGEYVYGQIYRNEDPKKIIKMIEKVHKNHGTFNVVIVHLTASKEFVISHDDKKSFTSDFEYSSKLEHVSKELAMFEECFDIIKPINYMKINVEGENNNYRNIDEIVDEILKGIDEMNINL